MPYAKMPYTKMPYVKMPYVKAATPTDIIMSKISNIYYLMIILPLWRVEAVCDFIYRS